MDAKKTLPVHARPKADMNAASVPISRVGRSETAADSGLGGRPSKRLSDRLSDRLARAYDPTWLRCLIQKIEQAEMHPAAGTVTYGGKTDPESLCRLRNKAGLQLQRVLNKEVPFSVSNYLSNYLQRAAYFSGKNAAYSFSGSASSDYYKKLLDQYHVQHRTEHRPKFRGGHGSAEYSLQEQLCGMGFDDFQKSKLQARASPYTHRKLPPFIFRDFECYPAKLRQLILIQSFDWSRLRTTGHLPILGIESTHLEDSANSTVSNGLGGPARAADEAGFKKVQYPIDYAYLSTHHVDQVNLLCQRFFWPGIDVRDFLNYPDYTVVVTYKGLVLGCGLMTPEGYIAHLLVHPDWRGAGVAKFMLYHLVQTQMGRDILLHVSACNPAMLLYQSFGFKVAKFVPGFYAEYIGEGTGFACGEVYGQDAFLLRLGRN